jgi:hypothetical protein
MYGSGISRRWPESSLPTIGRGQTERLVKKRIACEQADTPVNPRLDIAFTSMTAATGKEWLDAYRRSIKR